MANKDPEKNRDYQNQWYRNNREKILAKQHERRRNNLTSVRESERRYRKKNSHKIRQKYAAYVKKYPVKRRLFALRSYCLRKGNPWDGEWNTLEHAEGMLNAQRIDDESFVCTGGCGKAFAFEDLCLEHLHASGRIRGWTCHRCNLSIGNDHSSVMRDRTLYVLLHEIKEACWDAARAASNDTLRAFAE